MFFSLKYTKHIKRLKEEGVFFLFVCFLKFFLGREHAHTQVSVHVMGGGEAGAEGEAGRISSRL